MLVTNPANVSVYDFRRPNKLNREHVRALQIVAETFSRQLTTVLSSALRTGVHTTFDDVSQFSYDEYIRELPNPTLLTVIDLPPLKGSAMFHLPPSLTMGIVERLLGGSGPGDGPVPERAPTEIEMRLLRGLLERVFRELAYSFESLVAVTPVLNRTEINPQFAQVASATDMVVVIAFTVKVEGRPSSVTLGVPFSSLQPVLEDVTERNQVDRDGLGPEVTEALAHSMQRAAIEMRVRFDELLVPSRVLAGLRPGDILPLEHPVDQPLTVEVAGVPQFLATAGTRGKRVACLLTDTTGEVTSP